MHQQTALVATISSIAFVVDSVVWFCVVWVACRVSHRGTFIHIDTIQALSLSLTHTKHTIAFKKNWFRWNCRLFIGFRARYPCCQFESELWKYINLVCGNDWIIIICLKHCLFWLHTLLLIISMAFERRRHNFQKRSFSASVCILPFAPCRPRLCLPLFLSCDGRLYLSLLYLLILFHCSSLLGFYICTQFHWIHCMRSLTVCDM